MVVTGLRFVARGDGPGFMRHASAADNDRRAVLIADIIEFESNDNALVTGQPIPYPPPPPPTSNPIFMELLTTAMAKLRIRPDPPIPDDYSSLSLEEKRTLRFALRDNLLRS